MSIVRYFKRVLFALCGMLGANALVYAHNHTHWIVVTTINYPSQALKKLAALKDWHLVVVADKKTPLDWSLPNCEFLSVEKQAQLGYRIVSLLPWNHYCRKNIGYLYAIEHGARVIYDTDDDNILLQNSIPLLPITSTLRTWKSPHTTFNPYAYFGQPTLWPRGYPLEHITQASEGNYAQESVFIPIQQGMVNNDPDVDAIHRLTRNSFVTFEHNEPICLDQNIMCPFNSQNTLTYYPAFWGLVIPITTSFRVCDIWRGYWVQRLLWDLKAHLCFLPASALQHRNEHNLMVDFKQEIDLYVKAGKLVHFLMHWKSEHPLIFDRIIELTNLMVLNGYYQEKETAFMQAWLLDLQDAGYIPPTIA
jgi:hypothetical protein